MNKNTDDLAMRYEIHFEPTLRSYVDRRFYRDAMALMGATACVVSARFGEERLGRTVTSAFSVSVEPPTILVSIDRQSDLADVIAKVHGFSFAMLASDQRDVADAFAGRLAAHERFSRGTWLSWRSGHPRLTGAVAAMDCELIGTLLTNTHVLFAGGVVDVQIESERAPLIWHQRQYRSLEIPTKSSTRMLPPSTI